MRAMTSRGHDPFPASALSWISPPPPAPVLAIGRTSASLAARLTAGGHRLTILDKSPSAIRSLHHRLPGVTGIAAAPEALPFVPCAFEAVVVAQGLHLLAPGLALAEFARVLRPGGRLTVLYTVRDDSVPWVRRLRGIIQSVDPQAMRPEQGLSSVSALEASPYFPQVEQRDFRMWVPVTKEGLLDMVATSPRVADLDDLRRAALLDEVGQLYEGSARAPGPLLLPYRVACWRAQVDHTELTAPLEVPDEGLQITL